MKRKTLLYRAFILAGLLSVFFLPGIIGVHADDMRVDFTKYWDQNNNEQPLVYGVTDCTVRGFRIAGWVACNEQPNCIRMDIFSHGADNQGIGYGYWATQSDSSSWVSNPGDKDVILATAGNGYTKAYRFDITFNLDNWYDNPNFRLNQHFTIRIRYFAKDNTEIKDIMWATQEGTARENLDAAFKPFDAHTITGAPYTKTYTGAAISYPDSSVSAESNGAKSYTYFDADKKELTYKPFSAGNYYVKITTAETKKYTQKTSDYVPITIHKAMRTLSLSKGAKEGTPHVLTYPASDTFVVSANGTEDPGAVTATDTNDAFFRTDTQTVTTTPIKATDGVQSTTVTMAETQNYHAATATYYYNIEKGTIEYTASDYEGIYDQAGHGIALNIASPADTVVCFGTAADACLPVENPTYSDVGDYTVHFTIEKENYHAVADSRKVKISPVYLTMTFDADGKDYDTTAKATGIFTLSGVLSGDAVDAQAASTTFASALPGTHTVTASGITLDNKNYALDASEIIDTATISPIENLVITHISDAINAVTDVNMTALVHQKLTTRVPRFPEVAASSATAYNDGTFGSVTDAQYNRHTAYVDVLGVLNDSMPFSVRINGITVASGTLNVTTGHDMVYGTNEVKPQNASHQPVEILKFANTWEENQEAHTASIATGDATTVTFKAYLRAGEKLQVATAIGIYHGRTIVTVRENGLLLATDKIDAFFPVSYEESYIISDMTTTRYIGTKNPNRGDYLDQVPEFVAPHAGVYDITINVTGESYLLDAQFGLGAMYQGNSPASTPITTLESIEILAS